MAEKRKRERLPYPKSVFFIISNEFCERFSFYGMRTILSLYLKNQLKFSDTTSTVIYHAFIMICYFFPLLGAIVADSWLGKYRTILYLSIVYALGNIVVSTTAIPDTLPPQIFTMVGLVLIALGTGGIKPCVAAFGGDQFVLPQQEDQLRKFFSVFYFVINCGSFASTFLTPILREVHCFGNDSCYSLAFGVSALLMLLSIVIYVCGKTFYKIKTPEGNVVVKVAQCMWYALTKGGGKKLDHWLDKAKDKYDQVFVDDIKAALGVLILYIPLPVFWALFDQQGSRWTFQAARMNGEVGGFKIQADQIQVLNPLLILAFIPLFDNIIYPCFAKCNLLTKPLQRLTVGGLLAGASFGISAFVEWQLEPTYPILPQPKEGQLRLYNELPSNLEIVIPQLEESFALKSLDVWEKLHIPVLNETTLKFTYKYKNNLTEGHITVYENAATSYTFMADRILQIRNENADKSDNGNPKVMIIYSEPGKYGNKTISFYDTGKKKEALTRVISDSMPYTNYAKIDLSSDKYILRVDSKDVKSDIEFKQGGGYVALIMNTGTEMTAEIKTITKPNSIHILYLIPQYVIMTAGEVMFSVTGLEFSFSQAPVSMKSLIQALWLLTVAMGNLIVVIIAESKLFERQLFEFLLFAGLMILVMLVFALMAMRYKYVKIEDEDEDQPEIEGKDKS